MNVNEYAIKTELILKVELEKLLLLAYYYRKSSNTEDFTIDLALSWFTEASLAQPNGSRLKRNITSSTWFIKGNVTSNYKIALKKFHELEKSFGQFFVSEEVIFSENEVLSEAVYVKTRGYIEALAKQINASYEHNIFDGCAVLMRRLMEVLLILSYQNLNIDASIRDGNGNFFMLEKICSDAINNNVLSLSRTSKQNLNIFRDLGNFSAHRIEYVAHKSDIKDNILIYRTIIEELLYKSGIK